MAALTILRETGRLIEELVKDGKEPVILSLRAQSYFSFRGTGSSSPDRSRTAPATRPSRRWLPSPLDYFSSRPRPAASPRSTCRLHLIRLDGLPGPPEVRRMPPLKAVDVEGRRA